MRPHAGMERVRWIYAQRGVLLHDIPFCIKSVASPQLIRPFQSPKVLGSGCVECQGNPNCQLGGPSMNAKLAKMLVLSWILGLLFSATPLRAQVAGATLSGTIT